MDIELSNLDEKKKFDVKLQISLYNTAIKVFRSDKEEEFKDYMDKRIKKIKEILNIKERSFRILEDGELIFEVTQ